MRIQTAALAALLLLAGCGGSKGVASSDTLGRSSSAVVSASPTASPSPSTWTTAQAARRYVALTARPNALNAQWGKEADAGPLAHDVTLAQQLAAADDAFARGLSAGLWPAAARASIQALIPYVLRARIGWLTVARSSTMQEVIDSSNAPALNDPATPAAATAVRIALGLPSN